MNSTSNSPSLPFPSDKPDKKKPIDVVVYAYKRTGDHDTPTKLDFSACEKIGPRQFRDIDHLRESLEIIQQISEDTIYLYDFSGQDFRGADLSKLTFNGCSFKNCDMEDANFNGVELHGADFTGANLKNASFAMALLGNTTYGVIHKNRPLQQASLAFDYFDFGPARFDNADLTGADFVHARLQGAHFHGTRLTLARMDHADCSGIQCNNTCFAETKMQGTDITDAAFTNAPLTRAQLKQARGNAAGHSRHEARRLRRMHRPAP